MFALLKQSSSRGLSEPIEWLQELIQATVQQQPEPPSFLDRLAAPTVFLQQALLFETSLDSHALKAAVAVALRQYPPFGYRLSSDEDGQLITVPHSPAGSSGVSFLEGHTSSLTLQQLKLQAASNPTSTNTNTSDTREASAGAEAAKDTTTTTTTTSSSSSSSSSSSQVHTPELPDLLFSHLPGSLTPAYLSTDLPLVHVALLQLHGGGCVLGVRMSHLLGDWTSLRLLLRHLAAAYTAAAAAVAAPGTAAAAELDEQPLQMQQQHGNKASTASAATAQLDKKQQQQQKQEEGEVQAGLVSAAPLLNQLVDTLHQEQQAAAAAGRPWVPVRLKPLQKADKDRFSMLAALSSSSSSSQRPVRLSYYVPPGRLQQMKQQLLAEAAAPPGSNTKQQQQATAASGSGGQAWCSSHNALLASVLQAFGGLPGRQGVPHDVSVAADMRGRLPQQQLQLLGRQGQQALAAAVGNFFASAIVEDCVAQECSRAQLAQALHAAVHRSSEVWLPDLAWAAGIKGMAAVDTSPAAPPAAAAPTTAAAKGAAGVGSSAGVAAGEVTWRRLHAMGPTALLQQQMQLGLLASLSTTQWPLHFQADTSFAGQVPSLAVPSFSQPQPYPLVLTQQATPAQGGGWMVHVFLDESEAAAMQAAVQAQGGI